MKLQLLNKLYKSFAKLKHGQVPCRFPDITLIGRVNGEARLNYLHLEIPGNFAGQM